MQQFFEASPVLLRILYGAAVIHVLENNRFRWPLSPPPSPASCPSICYCMFLSPSGQPLQDETNNTVQDRANLALYQTLPAAKRQYILLYAKTINHYPSPLIRLGKDVGSA